MSAASHLQHLRRALAGAAALLFATVVPAAEVEHLNAGSVMPDGLPFSAAVRVDDTVYLSGQIGVKPGTLTLVEGGMAAQARQTLENIRTTLEANGLGMNDIVKCTVMLADMDEWGAFNEVYQTFFEPPYPARSALGANGLALGGKVEVECLAVRSARRQPDAPRAATPTPEEPERVYKRPNAQ
jgi:reactive intermediate/imine deaminase